MISPLMSFMLAVHTTQLALDCSLFKALADNLEAKQKETLLTVRDAAYMLIAYIDQALDSK
jgi:hypothetical protein